MRTATLICGILLLLTALEWPIIDRISPFLYIPLIGLAWLIFAGSAAIFVVRWIWRRKEGLTPGKPLLLYAVTMAAVMLVPFTDIELWLDFHLKQDDREAVVRDIQAGKLRPNGPHNDRLVALAPGKRLSAGGNQVMVDNKGGKRYVFFFTYRGFAGNYAGFLFVPPGGTPEAFGPATEKTAQLAKFSEHWYWVSRH